MSNRDGIGAVIQIGSQTNHMTTSVGYASSSDFGVHFGTGQRKEVERIDIRWPSGIRQTLRNVKTNQVLQIQEPVRDQRVAVREPPNGTVETKVTGLPANRSVAIPGCGSSVKATATAVVGFSR